MSEKIDVPHDAGHPLSGLTVPAGIRFTDDRAGIEARMMLAGYGDWLSAAARNHEPVQAIREIVARIIEITQKASHREMVRLVETAQTGKAN
jgi:hypothetical protein